MSLKHTKISSAETERKTKVTLHKSGKHWIRTLVSQVGLLHLFKGVSSSHDDLAGSLNLPMKTLLGLGAGAGSFLLSQDVSADTFANTVQVGEASSEDILLNQDGHLLSDSKAAGGITNTLEKEVVDTDSISTRLSMSLETSQSLSESIFNSASISESVSTSELDSVSVSHSRSVSDSLSVSESLSNSVLAEEEALSSLEYNGQDRSASEAAKESASTSSRRIRREVNTTPTLTSDEIASNLTKFWSNNLNPDKTTPGRSVSHDQSHYKYLGSYHINQ